LGVEAGHDDKGSACARARKWILDHGGATYSPLIGKAWLSVCDYYTFLLYIYIYIRIYEYILHRK